MVVPCYDGSKKGRKTEILCRLRAPESENKADCWPHPEIQEVFDSSVACKVSTILDLFSGCWKIKMGEISKDHTMFFTCTGTYQFEVLPFGLMNSPSTFQRMMNTVLKNVDFAQACLGDVVVHLKTMDDLTCRTFSP